MDKRTGKIIALAAMIAAVTAAVVAIVKFRYEILDMLYCLKEKVTGLCCCGCEDCDVELECAEDYEDFADVDEALDAE